MAVHVEDLITQDTEDVTLAIENLRRTIMVSPSSKRSKYPTLNPTMSVHPVYTQRVASPADELHRLSFTRFRVSAHGPTASPSRRAAGTAAAEDACQWRSGCAAAARSRTRSTSSHGAH